LYRRSCRYPLRRRPYQAVLEKLLEAAVEVAAGVSEVEAVAVVATAGVAGKSRDRAHHLD